MVEEHEPHATTDPGAVAAVPERVGILGGTGALGRGLALRWSMAGLGVHIGSRDGARAEQVAAALQGRLRDHPGSAGIVGGTNEAVALAEDVLVLAVPLEGLSDTLAPLTTALRGRVVVCAVNPLAFDAAGPLLAPVDGASVAESVAASVPQAAVVAAFHTVSSRELAATDRPMDDDVPVAGDDEAACASVVSLAERIDGCRGVMVGPLRLAASLEALTPVLISLNQRVSAHVGVRFSRLESEC